MTCCSLFTRLEPARALRIYDLLLACGWIAGAPPAQQLPSASATTAPATGPPLHAAGSAAMAAATPLWAGAHGAYSGELQGASADRSLEGSLADHQNRLPLVSVPFPGFKR